MSSFSSEILTPKPKSTVRSCAPLPQYGCHCHPTTSLERLPLLHAVLDRTAGSFVGQVFALICQIMVSLSSILLPATFIQRLMTVLECFDCIGFFLICCVEVLLPSLNTLIWGCNGCMSPACCDGASAALRPRRRSISSTAPPNLNLATSRQVG